MINPYEEFLNNARQATPEELATARVADTAFDRRKSLARWAKAGLPLRNALVVMPENSPPAKTFEAISAKIGQGVLFGLCGLRGRGKTQVGVELVKRHGGRFTTAVAISNALRPLLTAEERMNELCKPKLLVIDEAFRVHDTDWMATNFYELINRRHGDFKDTILIDNLTPVEFEKAAGDSIVSRMNQSGGVIECNWQDFRANYEPPDAKTIAEARAIYAEEFRC